jgi:peptidoglycan/LPS O-acetylase OafA/YrhL
MKRIPQLDSVRAIAILAVFCHHSLGIKLMWMGVDLFFILSGFLITGVLLSAKHHTLRSFFAHFYARRARRILVPYVLTLIVASFVFGVVWMRHWYLYILLNNFITPLHIPHPAAFNPFWSLAVEEQFYLAWPFAVYFLSERHLRRLSILLIVLVPVLRGVIHFHEFSPIYTLTPFRMDLLSVGALLGLEWKRNRAGIERWAAKIGAVLAVLGFAGLGLLVHLHISTGGNSRVGNVFIYELSLFICLGFMLYALSGWQVGWLRLRPLRYVGQISYSMYLVHMGIITLVATRLHGAAGAALSLALTIGYAALSWHLIESRLVGYKPKSAQPHRKDSSPAAVIVKG